MGMGDVKLAGVLGLYLGRAVGLAVLIGLVAGVVVGAIIISRKGSKEGRKTAVPFGPFLALGGIIAIFAGDAVADWYGDRF
jgi:leader peptidase (prepilin peptidase)/N-methyltransferase